MVCVCALTIWPASDRHGRSIRERTRDVLRFSWMPRCFSGPKYPLHKNPDRCPCERNQVVYQIIAFYRFVYLNNVHTMQAELRDLCDTEGIRGTVLLAEEGINGTIAGPPLGMARVLDWIERDPRLGGANIKKSVAEQWPFRAMKVRVKNEIVTMGVPELHPETQAGEYVKPAEWNAVLSDPHVVVIDTRNAYESDIGTFRGAILPNTRSFRDFPKWLRQDAALPTDQKIAMFCTGGIRCEKATSLLRAEGYENVVHLEGGILRYLEEVPRSESLWEGDCFVFDERVSVDHDLNPGDHEMCPACGRAVDAEGRAGEDYVKGVSCAGCVHETTPDQKARFAERERQVELAEARGELHLGAEFPPPQSKRVAKRMTDSDAISIPILYSFRRCPFAMRARLAIAVSGQTTRLREVVLRDKPPCLLEYSPKGTVPVLVLPDGMVMDESVEIMQWALDQSDPEGWLRPQAGERGDMLGLIEMNDGDFKWHLDRYKYASRYAEERSSASNANSMSPLEHRKAAETFLVRLEEKLASNPYLFGTCPSLADFGIAPFVRQFAQTDPDWFRDAPYPQLRRWLQWFVESECFKGVMTKYKRWHSGDEVTLFPQP